MSPEILLVAWSCAGFAWWLLSFLLVTAARSNSPGYAPVETKSLTIFKPLPPLEGRGLKIEARGLESFIAQLDGTGELLLGVHDADWSAVAPFLERMEETYPQARVVAVRRSGGDTLPNPKITWQHLLVSHAQGDLWLWSDSDIVAPPGFLAQARSEFATCGAEMLTFPYAIRELPHRPALLDALFVNAEFYPGVLLLRLFGPVDFGLGSAMLFSRESFFRKADWDELGCSLADDFMLGQILKPVQLSSATLETVADAKDWPAALAHYFRWKKTVCWCRPMGFAAQIIVMPLMGWLAWVLIHPLSLMAWAGLLANIQMDVLFAVLICRQVGCRLQGADLLWIEAWSLGRIVFWILCWLPGAVKWREKCWKEPVKTLSSKTAGLS